MVVPYAGNQTKKGLSTLPVDILRRLLNDPAMSFNPLYLSRGCKHPDYNCFLAINQGRKLQTHVNT